MKKSSPEHLLHEIVNAWESLPGGRRHRPIAVEKWLCEEMAPVIRKVRDFLGRIVNKETGKSQ